MPSIKFAGSLRLPPLEDGRWIEIKFAEDAFTDILQLQRKAPQQEVGALCVGLRVEKDDIVTYNVIKLHPSIKANSASSVDGFIVDNNAIPLLDQGFQVIGTFHTHPFSTGVPAPSGIDLAPADKADSLLAKGELLMIGGKLETKGDVATMALYAGIILPDQHLTSGSIIELSFDDLRLQKIKILKTSSIYDIELKADTVTSSNYKWYRQKSTTNTFNVSILNNPINLTVFPHGITGVPFWLKNLTTLAELLESDPDVTLVVDALDLIVSGNDVILKMPMPQKSTIPFIFNDLHTFGIQPVIFDLKQRKLMTFFRFSDYDLDSEFLIPFTAVLKDVKLNGKTYQLYVERFYFPKTLAEYYEWMANIVKSSYLIRPSADFPED